MATLVFGMNQSLDGYVDHDRFAPSPALFRHFVEDAQRQVGSIYGGRMYGIMRYWDDDQPGHGDAERAFADAWRAQHKWVVSRTLQASDLGPNATLLAGDPVEAVRALKSAHDGEIEVAGPQIAQLLGELVDVVRIYLHPVVLGGGAPFFRGPRPTLRLQDVERLADDVVRLTYTTA